MMKRFWIVGSIALSVSATGCTTMANRVDRPMGSFAKAWDETPAPVQRQTSLPPERPAAVTTSDAASPLGLSKYFPGLVRNNTEAPKVAATPRTPWFSFARRSKPSQSQSQQTYTTDARSALSRSAAEAPPLPVALQIHPDRATDVAVTPTSAVTDATGTVPKDAAPPAPTIPASDKVSVADLAGPSNSEVNPLPPAVEPNENPLPPAAEPAVANRMPELPAIDPRERPKLNVPGPSMVATDSRVDPASLGPQEVKKSDEQAVKAIPSANDAIVSAGLPDPTVQASFLHRLASRVKGTKHVHQTTILASPQGIAPPKPTPQTVPKPTPQVAAKPAIKPTGQTQPTTQASAAPEDCDDPCIATHGKKTCLCRMIRKVFKVGEFRHASPATTP